VRLVSAHHVRPAHHEHLQVWPEFMQISRRPEAPSLLIGDAQQLQAWPAVLINSVDNYSTLTNTRAACCLGIQASIGAGAGAPCCAVGGRGNVTTSSSTTSAILLAGPCHACVDVNTAGGLILEVAAGLAAAALAPCSVVGCRVGQVCADSGACCTTLTGVIVACVDLCRW
jgi:hypothetical protein